MHHAHAYTRCLVDTESRLCNGYQGVFASNKSKVKTK